MSVEDKAPTGSWGKRNPTFKKTFRAMMRRSFLIKIRDKSVIIPEIASIIILVVPCIVWLGSITSLPEESNPKIKTIDDLYGNISYQYLKAYIAGKGLKFVEGPSESPELHKIITNYWGRAKFPTIDIEKYQKTNDVWSSIDGVQNISETAIYVNSLEQMKEKSTDSNEYSNGIFLNNVNESNFYTNMSVDLFENNNMAPITNRNIEMLAYTAYNLAGRKLNAVNNIANQKIQSFIDTLSVSDAEKSQYKEAMKIDNSTTGFIVPNVTATTMARPEISSYKLINLALEFFSTLPSIISGMAELSLIIEDKESHMMTFLFLMGATETTYWLSSNIMLFVLRIIPQLVLCIIYSFAAIYRGTSFTLMLVMSLLYILSMNQFQNFLSTFFVRLTTGRVLIVVFLIGAIFFGYLNAVYMLQAPEILKHIVSLLPFEPWELYIHVMFEHVRMNRPAFTWSNIYDDYGYPIYYALIWLALDTVIWGALFLIFNAIMPRGFGSPLINLKNLFKKKKTNEELSDVKDEEDLIKVNNLVKVYPTQPRNTPPALNDVSFEIKKGEVIVMIGPNGAGKSTLINTISGAIPYTSGSISFGDYENSLAEIQKCLGIVFQENVIYKMLSIREHLEIFGRIRGIDEQTLQDSIDFFADNLQLREMLPNRAGDLSGGQKRKLCIALSLLGNPPVIMMDEPTAGVDVQARQLIWKTIASLKESTCIVTTHALEEAEAVSSRMFVVSNGKIPFEGTSTELRNKFKCGYLLKVDLDNGNIQEVLEVCKQHIEAASLLQERNDTICIPVDKNIGKMLINVEKQKEKLGITKYTFTVEQLEDVLLRILEQN